MNVFLKLTLLIIILLLYSCSDKINAPVETPVYLYRIDGIITHNGSPLPLIEIKLDTLSCITDSTGYYLFDSLKSGQSEITIEHPRFKTVDTLINVNNDLFLNFDLHYKSESFLPLNIGNKWYYNEGLYGNEIELIMEVVGTQNFGGSDYYKLQLTHLSDSSLEFWYLRIENNTLFRYACDEEIRLVPFDIDQGINIIVRYCSVDYIGRTDERSDDEISISYTPMFPMTDADFGFSFLKGVGITDFYNDGWYSYVLDHYEISE